MQFGASRAMLSTALGLLRLQALYMVWMRRGNAAQARDCSAILTFATREEAESATSGLHDSYAPFASSSGRLVARWASARGSVVIGVKSSGPKLGATAPSAAPRCIPRPPSGPPPSQSPQYLSAARLPPSAYLGLTRAGDTPRPSQAARPSCPPQPWSPITPRSDASVPFYRCYMFVML